MSGSLALDYRPVRFADVVGQSVTKTVVRGMVHQDNVHPALIFAGSRGTGKTSCARILAAALNCEAPYQGDACGRCYSCKAVQEGNSLSVIEVDAASNGGVAEIRRINDLTLYAHPGRWRVLLLDEAHSLSREAFNALLAALENPPERTVYVLLTTEGDKIPETVRSRCWEFDFKRLSNAEIVARLAEITSAESFAVEPDLLAEIATRVDGGMRDAVMRLDQCRRVGITTSAQFTETYGLRNVAGTLVAAALAADLVKGYDVIEEVFAVTGDASQMVSDLVAFIADMLAVTAGGTPRRARGESDAAARVLLASKTTPGALVGAMKVLWDLKARLRGLESDPRAQMDMAFVLITDVLKTRPYRDEATTSSKSEMPIQPAKSSTPLSLAELRSLSQS